MEEEEEDEQAESVTLDDARQLAEADEDEDHDEEDEEYDEDQDDEGSEEDAEEIYFGEPDRVDELIAEAGLDDEVASHRLLVIHLARQLANSLYPCRRTTRMRTKTTTMTKQRATPMSLGKSRSRMP
jgi:hypothetical protein